jgi:ABC-type amino acid transport substrate-binding protein
MNPLVLQDGRNIEMSTKGKLNEPVIVGLLGDNRPFLYKNEAGEYDGVDMEIWRYIARENGYDSQFVYINSPNYDQEVDNLANGKYDILLGNLSITYSRSKEIAFSSIQYLDRNRVVYKYNPRANYYRYIQAFLSRSLMPFSIILFLTVVLGFLLSRRRNKAYSISMWETFTALLGDSGPHSAKVNIKSVLEVVIAVLILIISFYFTVYLQGATTTDIIRIESNYDKYNSLVALKDKSLIVLEGSSQKSHIDRLREEVNIANVVYKDPRKGSDVVSSGIADMYLKNTDKYAGFLVSEEAFASVEDKYPSLKMSSLDLGYDEIAIGVNRNKSALLEGINVSLAKIKDNGLLSSICKKFFTDDGYTKCFL